MPEGHTIHRLARDHTRDFVGQRLRVTSPQGRFSSGARRINGRNLQRVEAFGKHLFYGFDGERILHVHLGLYGKFRRHRLPAPDPRGAVRVRAVGDALAFDLNGPTACEVMDTGGRDRIVARLGQDPLRKDADPEAARTRIRKSRGAIGRLLLDQSVIAGVGNIFRAEAMFLTGVHPERRGDSLNDDEFDALWDSLLTMMKVGVRYNRIITTDAKAFGKTPSRLTGAERMHIYGKESCPRCASRIRSWDLGGRTIHACPKCQPLPRGSRA